MGENVTVNQRHGRDNNSKDVWKSFALYGFSSLNLGLMIAGGYYFGSLLEKILHLSNLRITGVLVGLALGLYEMFMIAIKMGSKK